jgi:hypothetical protein
MHSALKGCLWAAFFARKSNFSDQENFKEMAPNFLILSKSRFYKAKNSKVYLQLRLDSPDTYIQSSPNSFHLTRMKQKSPSITTSADSCVRYLTVLFVALLVTANITLADNTTGTAISVGPFSTSTSQSVSGAISPAGDRDFYRFVLTVSGRMSIQTAGSTDTYGILYNQNGGSLAQNDDSGAGLNFLIERDLTPGTYFIRVTHYSQFGTGPYTLNFSFQADDAGGDDDHGDSIGAATPIALVNNAGSASGRIGAQGDFDFFRINVPANGRLVLNSTGTTDVYGALLNANGGQITADDDSGEGYNFRMDRSVAAGIYYLRVRHYSSFGTGPYVVQAAFTPTAPPPGTQPDSSGALTITLPHAGNYAIDRAGDVDTFRFTVSGQGRLNIRTTGSTDTYGTLLNAQNRILAYNDDSAGTLNFNISYDVVTPGTYTVQVRHFSSSRVGPYRLLVDFTPVGVAPTPVDPANPPPPVVEAGSARRAVVVGISNYQYISDLNLCDDDARAMARLLRSNGWTVTLLLDNQASKAAIRSAIQTQVVGASEFIFHFSGHGTRYGSTGYVCTWDGRTAGTFYSEDELSQDIGRGGPNLRAGIILDSCHSGEFISRGADAELTINGAPNNRHRAVRFAHPADSRERPGTRNGAAGVNLSRDLQRNGWTVLTGSRGSQYSYEVSNLSNLDAGLTDHVPPTVNQNSGHGWLSWQIITRLPARATDANRNNFGSIEEVHNLVRGGYNGIQHPQLYDGDNTRQFDAVSTSN